MFANRFTLQSRLIFAVLLPCVALIIVGMASFNSMSTIQRQAEQLYLNTAAPMRSMAEVASRIPRMRVGIDMMLLQETSLRDKKGVLTRVKETRDEDIPEMRQSVEHAVQSQVDPEQRRQVQQLLTDFEKMVSTQLNPMLAAFEKDDLDTARNIYRDQYAVTYGELRKKANVILDSLLEQAKQQNVNSQKSYAQGQNHMFIIIGIGVLISFVTSFFIVIGLKTRVASLQKSIALAAENMALDARIDLGGQDELSKISDSFNDFIEKVHVAIKQVASSSYELANTANQVSARALLTKNNCTSQRDRTVQVATAIHELGATVGEIANNAAQAADVAKQATHQAENGTTVVEKAQVQIADLISELEQAAQVVGSLAGQVVNISSILETIRSISEQTNLLALNAAIEAARAGEQGRGFAVVADEVRNLASRSAASTEEIQRVINNLQEESKRAVGAMSQGREQSLLVVEQAENANSSLKQIRVYIENISDQNIQVATATEEQSSVVSEINRTVEDINHLTMETTTVAEELTVSSEHLKKVSKQLDSLVNNFKL
ncbi:methyl-accepting chemotaxis protein [Vibrio anguillarum]|uniref:methyl-accepting chemotaxis protein n=1 Tax=Vibrio anguillarum TaxID=55601 RepID=UPI00097E1847|nr:methyl-accepting chemotaxis protein [Vibrio anguillarum]MBF4281628.1 methyl-accepting chemotaxis protein [Vibrio anguillarum]MBF4288483.1 methyl-accepting chemotaxis protein [Vibrio anguillarum]MBF4341329.1 methyl-accepting chemotaxis protein [Vibrio anguillarum]MBF4356000.1 methyl-accepting chemotaxis protein [Vibrio anguillarum]MBF4380048.1 methyl-accepting chemotaxis protein [Vibrio anguillarum]